MKKRILHVVGQLSIGGQEMMALNFFKYINREEFTFDYIVYGEHIGELEKEVLDMGGRVFHLPLTSTFNILKNYKMLYLHMLKYGPYDVVHSHTYLNNGIILLAAKKAKIKTRISHCHTSESGKSKKFIYNIYAFIMKQLIKNYSTEYIACSQNAGNHLYGKHCFNNYGIVIKNGIDLESYCFNYKKRKDVRDQLGISKNTIVLGNVSRLSKEKNHTYMIAIAHELKKSNLNFLFLLVGGGPLLNSLKEECEKQNVSEIFLFLGPREDVPSLLQAMDIIIHPSFFEGLPVALVEAQAAGLPCIISANITHEIKMSENVSFIDIQENSISLWVKKIIEYSNVLRNNDCQQLKQNGYDIKESCKILESIYNS